MDLSKKDYDEIRSMLSDFLDDLPILSCEDFHHVKRDQHTGNYCPVVNRFYRNLDKLTEAFGLWYEHPYNRY